MGNRICVKFETVNQQDLLFLFVWNKMRTEKRHYSNSCLGMLGNSFRFESFLTFFLFGKLLKYGIMKR